MASQSNISPEVAAFISVLAEYFDMEDRLGDYGSAAAERLRRCTDDDEVIRVAQGIVELLKESTAIVSATTQMLSLETIDMFPASMSDLENARLAEQIKAIQ